MVIAVVSLPMLYNSALRILIYSEALDGNLNYKEIIIWRTVHVCKYNIFNVCLCICKNFTYTYKAALFKTTVMYFQGSSTTEATANQWNARE